MLSASLAGLAETIDSESIDTGVRVLNLSAVIEQPSIRIATVFAFVGWQRGISRIGANRTLIYQYLITAVGVTSGIVFFGERLGGEKVVGGAVILLGVYLARRQ